jgi:two-component system, OmpR family, response regulator MprA
MLATATSRPSFAPRSRTLMQAEPTLPVTVFVIAVEDGEQKRLMPLFPPDESRVVAMAADEIDAISATEVPDVFIVNAREGAAAVLETVRHLRRRWPSPSLLCIHVGSPADAIALLEAGADDVTMEEAPFEVVAALLNAALRRARVINEQLRIKFGDIVYDREARRVWCAGREVAFTPRELRLFDILFQRAGNPVSADTLQDFVWNDGPPTKSNSLAVYIGYLRRKLKGSRISMLETLRGSGYRLARRD